MTLPSLWSHVARNREPQFSKKAPKAQKAASRAGETLLEKIELFPRIGQNDSSFWPGPYLTTLPSNTRISVFEFPSATPGAGSEISDNGLPPPRPPLQKAPRNIANGVGRL